MFQNPELKIDKEFEDLLLTDTDCTPLFVPFFYKKIKRVRGEKQPCIHCNNGVSGNIEGSIDCPYCEAIGYQWSEGIYNGWFYKKSFMTDRSITSSVPLEMAIANFNKLHLVFDKGLELEQDDIIFRPKIDLNKKMLIPIQKEGMYKISEEEHNSSNQTFSEFNTVVLTSSFGKYFRGVINA